MEGKSKMNRFDPVAEYDSESESDKRFATSIYPDLNVANDFRGNGLWRNGGPLMDPSKSKKKQSKPETRECINCKEQTTEWYSGQRFDCDRDYVDDIKHLAAHNKLCRACATDEERCPRCPYHVLCFYKCDVVEDEVPQVVWSSQK